MENMDNAKTGTWEQIHNGVRETERLIGQKNYNLAMVKSRQTLEYMVKCLCERSDIPETGLLEMIDALHAAGIISSTTREHYHQIRMIGNKAIHEGDNSAYNANQAHHFLSQEVYTFANDYNERKRQASLQKSTGQNRRRSRPYAGGPAFELRSILKPLLLIFTIILLLLIIKTIHPAKEPTADTTSAATESSTSEREVDTPTPEQTILYRTIDTVNIRPTPSTDSARIGVLAPGSDLEYLRDYDEKWAVIQYNGQEAYVSRDFIRQVSQ